ncbi:hypothetical protein JMJ77_0008822 [Colletotrichum scovillei]|uniref:Uncharacterized protein n=1 Tax=Colletotrichum scovillei TaxID=1209932 RepID=A0A9P7QU13_9PEZI|nr:hypothetical protein JMJ78_0001674 [Colletotrichum scovillei]KAG7041118.1 hypothetical protein JMJ77_0008822 [Colletotrichum scovillei]
MHIPSFSQTATIGMAFYAIAAVAAPVAQPIAEPGFETGDLIERAPEAASHSPLTLIALPSWPHFPS